MTFFNGTITNHTISYNGSQCLINKDLQSDADFYHDLSLEKVSKKKMTQPKELYFHIESSSQVLEDSFNEARSWTCTWVKDNQAQLVDKVSIIGFCTDLSTGIVNVQQVKFTGNFEQF